MDNIRGEMNAAVTGQDSTAKRIAGEASREYVFSKDKKLPSSKDDIKQQIAHFDRSKNDRKPSTLGSSGFATGVGPSGCVDKDFVILPFVLPPKCSRSKGALLANSTQSAISFAWTSCDPALN